jgi:hypothetical protein
MLVKNCRELEEISMFSVLGHYGVQSLKESEFEAFASLPFLNRLKLFNFEIGGKDAVSPLTRFKGLRYLFGIKVTLLRDVLPVIRVNLVTLDCDVTGFERREEVDEPIKL